MKRLINSTFFLALLGLLSLASCHSEVSQSKEADHSLSFEVLSSERTGLDFSNDLTLDLDMNIFRYMYFYNGGGVGAGDFNGDGLVDLYFTSNQAEDRLYINEGDLRFADVTEQAGILHSASSWNNGVSIVDINQDGLLDIYVSNVSDFQYLDQANQLWLCTGIESGVPKYREAAAEFGLDLKGFCTQAVFFDYDRDNDLDMFQLKHSVHDNGTFGQRKTFDNSPHPLAGDKLFENRDGRFIDVTEQAGIHSSVIGYGLGVVAGDVNNDGWVDLYIGNDFHENDYLYINNQDGTFSESLTDMIMHTSRFSMGVDMADINGDGWNDIVSLDMLPEDPTILKMSEGEDALNVFRFKLGYGYNHQYAKNNLQLNNGDGSFSDVAMMAGVHATDWSWAPLFADFDMDGRKDLFISNGIPKRMNDIDYINFMKGEDVQWKIKSDNMEQKDLEIINKLPEIKLPNKFYHNSGKLSFQDQDVSGNPRSYSNGAVSVDLDNDGDLDIVSNNINDEALVYINSTRQATAGKTISLTGPEGNRNAIGARILMRKSDDELVSIDNYPVRGFQSASHGNVIIPGLPGKEITILWPDGSTQIELADSSTMMTITYSPSSEGLSSKSAGVVDLANPRQELGIQDASQLIEPFFVHKENDFIEFLSEPLIPHMTSSEGPTIAVADFNGDGNDDFFVGGAKRQRSGLYLSRGENWIGQDQSWMQDSVIEETASLAIDLDEDGDQDLIIGAGGSEWDLKSVNSRVRLLINDGQGNFQEDASQFGGLALTCSSIVPFDMDGDGLQDLLFTARSHPRTYGKRPSSYVYRNMGKGKYENVSEDFHEDLSSLGMIKDAIVCNIDTDAENEIVLAMEWDKIKAFDRTADTWHLIDLTDRSGWWNVIHPVDIDSDGDIDLVAGNLGLNSRLTASESEPLRMYYHDFDGNGSKEHIVSYFLEGRELPFSNKMELESQMPVLKKKYLYAKDFAQANAKDLFGVDVMRDAVVLESDYFSNAILINDGSGKFELQALPRLAQKSPIYAVLDLDIDGDDDPDLITGGNYYDCNIQLGRYDADYGSILLNDDGTLEAGKYQNLGIKGQVKHIQALKSGGNQYLLIARNDEPLKLMRINSSNI